MCVVSMVMEHYKDRWTPYVPDQVPYYPPPYIWPNQLPKMPKRYFDDIAEEEIAEFRRLLERAKEYDKRNNEPHCEDIEKKRKIQELADSLGVDISFINEV